MPTKTLTDRFIRTLRPPSRRIEYHDTIARGLVLRVTPTGAQSWALRYRAENGSTQRLTLGTYPDLGLKGARKEADIHRGTIADGDDPSAAKQAERVTAAAAKDTIADLAKEYIDRYAKAAIKPAKAKPAHPPPRDGDQRGPGGDIQRRKRSWREDQRMIDAEILPRWRTRKVEDIKRRDVRELLNAIVDRGAPIAANRYLALIRKMFNYAIGQHDWELEKGNPATLIDKPGEEASRDRVLEPDELRLVWKGCEIERPLLCALTRLRLVTLQRGNELAHLRWTYISGDWITLPGTLTKNKHEHRVFLTDQAKDLLATIPRIKDCEWVFPGSSDRRPLGDEKKAGPRIRAWVLVQLQQADPSITGFDFRLHDLRRTGSTLMAKAGVPEHDISKVLNHVEGESGSKAARATKVYNRYHYDPEKRRALETWSRILTGILDDEPTPASVVPFVRA